MKNMKKVIIIILICIISVILIITGYSIFNSKVKIIRNETNSIKYEKYDNGLVSMQIPKGWKVEVGTSDFDRYMYYTFTAYNPQNPSYRIFFSMKTEGYLKTEKMRNWYKGIYPNTIFSTLPYLDPLTVENFYNNFTNGLNYFFGKTISIPNIKNFEKIETIGKNTTGGDIIRATYEDESGQIVDGIFTATLKEVSLYYVTAISVYNTIFYTAPENELIEWENILNNCISTIKFSDEFVTNFYKSEDTMLQTINKNQAIYDEMADIITAGWQSRQNTYDIISQKQSDATLGYERVYDTKTGEIYKAYNGFIDDYSGNRYQSITDEMYNLPTNGYIEKTK